MRLLTPVSARAVSMVGTAGRWAFYYNDITSCRMETSQGKERNENKTNTTAGTSVFPANLQSGNIRRPCVSVAVGHHPRLLHDVSGAGKCMQRLMTCRV